MERFLPARRRPPPRRPEPAARAFPRARSSTRSSTPALLGGARPGPSRCATLAGAGARLIQLRAKDLGDRAFLDWRARRWWRPRTRRRRSSSSTTAPDVARIAGADGVHVGQDDLPPAACRAAPARTVRWSASPRMTSRRSRRRAATPAGLRRRRARVRHAQQGHARPVVGLAARARGARAAGRPLVAIGGITPRQRARGGGRGCGRAGRDLGADGRRTSRAAALSRALAAALQPSPHLDGRGARSGARGPCLLLLAAASLLPHLRASWPGPHLLLPRLHRDLLPAAPLLGARARARDAGRWWNPYV